MNYGELFEYWTRKQRNLVPFDSDLEEKIKPFLPLPRPKSLPSTMLSLLYDMLVFFDTYLLQLLNSTFPASPDEIKLQQNTIAVIKHKLQFVAQSLPIASYVIHKRKLYFLPHGGMGDQITMIAAIRYYSMIYDQLVVGVRQRYYVNTCSLYRDDASITVHGFTENDDDTCRHMPPYFYEQFRSKGYEILVPSVCCWGGRVGGKPSLPEIIFYRAFYIQCDLNYAIRWQFSHIYRDFKREMDLFLQLHLDSQPYLFVHGDETVMKKARELGGDLRIVTPEHDMLDYCTIIERAQGVFVMDSSFFCLCTVLNLQATQKYCYARIPERANVYKNPTTRYASPTDHWIIEPLCISSETPAKIQMAQAATLQQVAKSSPERIRAQPIKSGFHARNSKRVRSVGLHARNIITLRHTPRTARILRRR